MKAVIFTRGGKPDMRLIHEDVGDTYETIVSHIKTEFAGKKLDIYGVTEYEDANEWLRFRLEMEIALKQKEEARRGN